MSNLEILAYEPSPLGPLCLRRRELLSDPGPFVTEVTLNHEFLMSSLYADSEQALARLAVEMHAGDDLKVLVGGLGLGYTARDAIESDRVALVEVVELLPQVIDWLDRGLVPLSSELCAAERLTVTQGDPAWAGRLVYPLLELIVLAVATPGSPRPEQFASGRRTRRTGPRTARRTRCKPTWASPGLPRRLAR